MRPLMAVALAALLCASLAGCADDPERYPNGVPTPSTSRASTTTGGPTTSSSTSTTGPGNQAPTGTISLALNGTNATFTLNGTDADGDALAWELDFGDGNATNGTTLPTVLNHTYVPGNATGNGTGNATGNTTGNATGNATGNITVVFTLSDGVHQVNYTVNVTLGPGGPGQQLVFSGTMVAPDPSARTHVFCLQAAILEHEGVDTPGGDIHEIPAEVWGGSWVLAGDGIKAQFVDFANTVLLAEGQSGQVPEAADWVHICSVEAVNTPYTLTIDY